MAQGDLSITENELREAFNRSGLWRRGWNFQRAIATELVARSMRNAAIAAHKEQQKDGKPAPMQRALI